MLYEDIRYFLKEYLNLLNELLILVALIIEFNILGPAILDHNWVFLNTVFEASDHNQKIGTELH